MSTNTVPYFSPGNYATFFLAGGACACLTHGAVTPIDVVKTTIQIDPDYKGKGLVAAGRTLVAQRGPSALLTGFGPTAVGYLVQGGAKFAGYEYWKRQLVIFAGGPEASVPYRTSIYLLSASIAEFFADILLTPLEATRIRLVSERNYASGLITGFARMAREGGIREFYSGFVPILFKQIPFAVGQFTVNEQMHELVNRTVGEEKIKSLSPLATGGVTLGCGVVAGASAAILSQPADTLLSQINKGKGEGSVTSRLAQLAKQAGPAGLFAGLGPRVLMTAALVSGQFLLYDMIKQSLGAPKAIEIHKAAEIK